jgi:hypothetical protein
MSEVKRRKGGVSKASRLLDLFRRLKWATNRTGRHGREEIFLWRQSNTGYPAPSDLGRSELLV